MKKVIAVGVIALVSAGAAVGCSGGTTTVREVPVVAASSGQAATSAPATATVTAPASARTGAASTTGAQAEPAASTPASPTGQAGQGGQGGSAGQAGPAGQAGATSYCGSPADQGGISVNADTSCPFAENVESAWESSGGASSVTAYSPVTGLDYTMSCADSGAGYEVCTGGDNAWLEFPASGANQGPASGQFDDPCTQCAVSTLSQSVADEQQAALEAAPSYDYNTTDNATVNVALTPLGDNTYSATATDSDGDSGSGDTITVSPDGDSWSDTGMTWSGPDVDGGAAGDWTTPSVSDYS